MNAREHALKVMQRIIALKAELRALENELDQILPKKEDTSSRTQHRSPAEPSPASPVESPETVAGSNGTANLLDRILGLLSANPTASFSADQVCNRLNIEPELKHSVRSTLWNLCQKGRIQKIRRGEFGALKEA
jgi:hypothetical protein